MTDSPPVVWHSGSLDSLKRHPVASDGRLTSPYTHMSTTIDNIVVIIIIIY